MRAALRVWALGGLAAGVLMARPAGAAMTMALRDENGQTRTFYQDGNRVRIVNPSGTDDGEARIVDLKSTEHVVVYDDAKAWYDYNKTVAQLRAAFDQLKKTHPPDKQAPKPTVTYRALGENRQVNGFQCAMYEHLSDGKVEEQICFAAWGGAVGAREDFVWFDDLMRRMAGDFASEADKKAMARAQTQMFAREEGLPVSSSWTNADGSRGLLEIAKVSRDPLLPALFHVPSDYKEFSRPLTASEHPKLAPLPIDDPRTRVRSSPRISGPMAIMIGFVLLIGLLIHAALLHLAATVVLERARFTQAFVAAAVSSIALVVLRLIGLPPLLALPFAAFIVFAALKISYGASIARTIALFIVSMLIATGIALLSRGCGAA